MSSFGKFVLGTLVGGAIGAAVGILLAPRSGSDTRQLIGEEFDIRYHEAVDPVLRKAEKLKADAEKLSRELEEAGRKAMDSMRKKEVAASVD